MFDGEGEVVTVRFSNRLIGVVLDRFGKDVSIIPRENDTFDVRLKIKVSNQFFGWITGFSNEAKIMAPQKVVDEYKALIDNIKNNI